jgi:TonB family protein
MVVVFRLDTARLRSAASFLLSACLHGSILLRVAFGPVPQRAPSLYDMIIRPHESRIVWYNPSQRLPEIAPGETARDRRPPRARTRFDQPIVAGRKDDGRTPQMIYTPAPEISLPKPLPLPNMVAVALPRPRAVRLFAPPPPKPQHPAPLPEAPAVKAAAPDVQLPDATAALRPQPRAFIPPTPQAPPWRSAPAVLPAAPEVAAVSPSVNLPAADLRAPRRQYVPAPAAPPAAPAAPAPTGDAPEATLAIAGLNPVPAPDFRAPAASHLPGFSAGPVPRPGDSGAASPAPGAITVPGLETRGGPKDDRPTLVAGVTPSRQSLIDAAHAALRSPPATPPPAPVATRTASVPDPRFEGRAVYALAIQMPNVTSYSGSWIVWFAEHESLPGAPAVQMRPPVPLRKVDPKYIAAAAEERVEGIVRLFAVIRRNGYVDSIALIRHLDDRLDRSAQEALAKWEFEPALRNGSPVEVDAVFEIPFRLAPRPGK